MATTPAPAPAPGAFDDLAALADVRVGTLLAPDEATAEVGSALDALLVRLFDPRKRDLLTVSAFSSAL